MATLGSIISTSAVPQIAEQNLRALVEARSAASASTASATFATLASSASTLFTGRPVLLLLSASAWSSGAASGVEFAVQVDSGADAPITIFTFNTTGEHHAVNGWLIVTPAAGAHIINLRWRRTSGSGTVTQDLNDYNLLAAIEL